MEQARIELANLRGASAALSQLSYYPKMRRVYLADQAIYPFVSFIESPDQQDPSTEDGFQVYKES